MAEKTFPVIEIFGPTIQGEGAVAGRVTHFVRFGGCDYRCQWCDSSFAVLPEEVRVNTEQLTTVQILDRLLKLSGDPDWITLSGGNPALHKLDQLVEGLHSLQFKVAVETQGTLWKPWLGEVDQLTVSPKPPSAQTGKPGDLEHFMDLAGDQPNLAFKVPIFDENDYEFAAELHSTYPHVPFYLSIVTRMGGLYGTFDQGAVDTLTELGNRFRKVAEWAAQDALMGDTAVFPQLHVIAWGHKRGV